MSPVKPQVLVVDDEPYACDVFQRRLAAADYECDTAANAETALELLQDREFDLVLLDIVLPGLSGMDILEQLSSRYPETRVILVTAFGDVDTAVDAMKAGASDFVKKPVDLDDLVLRVQRALRGTEQPSNESEDVDRSLYSNAPVMMHLIDRNDRLTSVNNYWLEVLGYKRSEVIGRQPADFVAETSRPYREQTASPASLRTGSARDVEFQLVKKNGEVVDVLLSTVVERDEAGGVTRILACMVDVTERKRLEQALKELSISQERHRQAREIHGALAQSLDGIVARLETARQLVTDEPEAARREMASARGLAQESLEDVRRAAWDLQPLAGVSSSLSVAIGRDVAITREEGIHISLDVVGEQPTPTDRRNELTVLRVAQEALSNIRRHSQAKTARVRLTFGPSEYGLRVLDDGVGFDPAAVGRIVPSVAGDLCLTSIEERAHVAGGTIEIHSVPGMGTLVEARIPYRPGSEAPTLGSNSASRHLLWRENAGSIRVLVADDHEVVRRGIRGVLESTEGVVVVSEARDGVEVIEKIQALDPDVVLLDTKMPRLDGVATLRRLRELGLDTRVILLAAYARDENILEGLGAGARGYLLKEIGRDDLVHAIRTVHAGESLLQPSIADRLIQGLDNEASPHLTKRELEVLHVLGLGARNKEIADRLDLTVNTVKFHIENLYRKLDVHSRTQAIRIARQRGLLNY